MSDINSVGKNRGGKRTKESQDVDRVIILSGMRREAITIQLPFEQRSEEVREHAMGTFGEYFSRMKEQQLPIVKRE